LEEKVEFKERTAQRFMQAANEYSNPSTLTHLSQSKIFALLDLPPDQRTNRAKKSVVLGVLKTGYTSQKSEGISRLKNKPPDQRKTPPMLAPEKQGTRS